MKKNFNIAFLLSKYLANELTEEEKTRLDEWLDLSQKNREWFGRVTTATYQAKKNDSIRNVDIGQGWLDLQTKRRKARNRIRKNRWLYAGSIAAAVVIFAGSMLLLKNEGLSFQKRQPVIEITKITTPTLIETQGNDVVLSCDSLETERSAGIYIADTKPQSEEMQSAALTRYKTVVIPAGYTYRVELPDGSAVTLNAGSTLKFPEYFRDSLREVELTGEGFFEVAKADQPFTVKAGNALVTVYGTRFNLLFSEKLQLSEAVLVEGSIGMRADGKEIRIKPNQRISHYMDKHTTEVDQVDPEDYISWLNNSFKYNNMPLKRIVFDISQWYGIEITLDPKNAGESYSLEFDKSATADWVIQALGKITGKDVRKEGGGYLIK